MTEHKITMYTNIDLTPPKAAEESRAAVIVRTAETMLNIRLRIDPLYADPKTRSLIDTFLDEMQLFFEPQLPPELEALIRDWAAKRDSSAA